MERLSVDAIMDVIGELFSDEASIALSNTDHYIYYLPSKRIDLKIKPGDPVQEGTIAHKALTTNHKVSEFMNRDLFGVPYYGTAVPFQHEEKLVGCVTAIFPTLTNAKSVITIKRNDHWVPIHFSQVLYIEAREKKTYVITEDMSGTHNHSLNEFDFSLPKDSFVRCHRSYIINVNHIKEIYPDVHSTFTLGMKNGSKIPVSQSYSSYFKKLLGF